MGDTSEQLRWQQGKYHPAQRYPLLTLLLKWVYFNQSTDKQVIMCSLQCRMKLVIYFQSSTVAQLKFGIDQYILSTLYNTLCQYIDKCTQWPLITHQWFYCDRFYDISHQAKCGAVNIVAAYISHYTHTHI